MEVGQNSLADLLAAYNASGGGQTKSAWGEWHYCNHGRGEGRTYTGLSAASCGDSDSGGSGGDAFEGYVNKYADLLAAYNANSGGRTKSAWGEWHYCNHGLSEGRTYSGLSAASCSSSGQLDDGQEQQANSYEALFNVISEHPGVVDGAFLWGMMMASDQEWNLFFGQARGFDVRDKLAEAVVQGVYVQQLNLCDT